MNKKLRLKILELFDTQKRFAQKLRVSESYVSKIVHSERVLPVLERPLWSELLGISGEELNTICAIKGEQS